MSKIRHNPFGIEPKDPLPPYDGPPVDEAVVEDAVIEDFAERADEIAREEEAERKRQERLKNRPLFNQAMAIGALLMIAALAAIFAQRGPNLAYSTVFTAGFLMFGRGFISLNE